MSEDNESRKPMRRPSPSEWPHTPEEQAELARLNAEPRHLRLSRNRMIIDNVLGDVFDPPYQGRSDLLTIILALVEHLTPEQRAALAAQLAVTANGVTPPPAH